MNKILRWEILGFVFISFVGTLLHFTFELSGFARPMALISAVNESAWEHLKIAFWPTLLWALIEYTYIREEANNYILAKAASMWVNPLVVLTIFYGYMGFITGVNLIWIDIATFFVVIALAQWVSYRLLTRPPLGRRWFRAGWAAIVTLTLAFSLFSYFPPRMFLFEHFWRGEAKHVYGILDDYSYMLIFTDPDYYSGPNDSSG